jgi:uncharacterized protein
VIPQPVLTELFYLATQRLNYAGAVRLFDHVRVAFQTLPLTIADMERMSQIMKQYQDARFDLVDTALMALAERLNITTIYTFDGRDFGMYCPKHTSHFTLLP